MPFYLLRFVNEGDIVTTVPPRMSKDDNGYMHIGRCCTYNSSSNAGWVLGAPVSLVSCVYFYPSFVFFPGELWTITSTAEFVSELASTELVNHLLPGETGYFSRILRLLQPRLPASYDPNHPRRNPKLPFAFSLLEGELLYVIPSCVALLLLTTLSLLTRPQKG